jgi:hypothetical protein
MTAEYETWKSYVILNSILIFFYLLSNVFMYSGKLSVLWFNKTLDKKYEKIQYIIIIITVLFILLAALLVT